MHHEVAVARGAPGGHKGCIVDGRVAAERDGDACRVEVGDLVVAMPNLLVACYRAVFDIVVGNHHIVVGVALAEGDAHDGVAQALHVEAVARDVDVAARAANGGRGRGTDVIGKKHAIYQVGRAIAAVHIVEIVVGHLYVVALDVARHRGIGTEEGHALVVAILVKRVGADVDVVHLAAQPQHAARSAIVVVGERAVAHGHIGAGAQVNVGAHGVAQRAVEALDAHRGAVAQLEGILLGAIPPYSVVVLELDREVVYRHSQGLARAGAHLKKSIVEECLEAGPVGAVVEHDGGFLHAQPLDFDIAGKLNRALDSKRAGPVEVEHQVVGRAEVGSTLAQVRREVALQLAHSQGHGACRNLAREQQQRYGHTHDRQ